MDKFLRVLSKVRDYRDATRIWNWIDNQSEPEPLWEIMALRIPWAFHDPMQVNSLVFVY